MKFSFTNGIIFTFFSTIFYVAAVKYVRPSFIPYCITKAKCLSECQCKMAADNCTLLEMNDQLRNLVLFSHNQFRDILSNGEPSPAGLAILQYDHQLEEISRCWAVRCKNEKTECFVTPRFYETSQAVITIELSDNKEHDPQSLWMNMMNAYLVPAKSMSAEKVNTLPPDDIDLLQSAQVFSDRILFVGCAWSEHFQGKEKLWHFVCTYGPRGPVAGEPIFSIGKTCSNCPDYYECDHAKPFTRLCKVVREEEKESMLPPYAPSIPLPPPLLPPSQSQFHPIQPPLPPQPPSSTSLKFPEEEEQFSSTPETETEFANPSVFLGQYPPLSEATPTRVPGIQRQIYPHHLTESPVDPMEAEEDIFVQDEE